MTYDFFGTPWADELAHHTNLYTGKYSIDKAVSHLKDNDVNLKNVYIGYAGYSRSAKGAKIKTFNPLQGTYNKDGTTTGTFDSGATEYYDILYNYIDYENQVGRNNFTIYTDDDAHADYLYNEKIGLFMSIDTPRTVKEKR